MIQRYKILFCGMLLIAFSGCAKLVDIDPPTKVITAEEVFNNPATINSALAGLYSYLMTNNGAQIFSNGSLTLYGGLAADELVNRNGATDTYDYQFYTNTVDYTNGLPFSVIWQPAYKAIYTANAIIEGVGNATSPAVTQQVRRQAIAEAKFVRAFSYFYLVNYFGDLPLALTTDFNVTTVLERSPVDVIYQQILADLEDAAADLTEDYSFSGGERVLPNKWAATALLARVHLYLGHWQEAENASAKVIGNALYSLASEPDSVFLKNSTEAIWQLQQSEDNATVLPRSATWDGINFSPFLRYSEANPVFQSLIKDISFFNAIVSVYTPDYYLTSSLVSAFETDDKRKTQWLDSIPTPNDEPYNGETIYFAYKYKYGMNERSEPLTQYYMVLRLAEQYLIRAEARAELDNTTGAADDINMIRNRAGLDDITVSSKEDILAAVAHERRIELFAEFGHRWLDLKRTGKSADVLGSLDYKKPWESTQLLLPVPQEEISDNPRLTQNPGY